MKYTNKLNLPQSIVDSFKESDEPIKNRYSVTELLKSNKEILMTRKYWNQIEVDVSECINMLFGTAVHKVLEDNTTDQDIETEIKMEIPISNSILVGKFDRRNLKEQLIEDYKTCTATKISKQNFEEDRIQGLAYAYMTYIKTGILIKKLKFYNLIKDWSKLKCSIGSNYPSNPIYVWEYDIQDSDYDFIKDYITKKIKSLESDSYDDCSDDDRWYTGTKYAIYKKAGDKRAAYVSDSEEDAHNYITNQCNGAGEIQIRKGEYIKCKYYCNLSKFCNQCKEEN